MMGKENDKGRTTFNCYLTLEEVKTFQELTKMLFHFCKFNKKSSDERIRLVKNSSTDSGNICCICFDRKISKVLSCAVFSFI